MPGLFFFFFFLCFSPGVGERAHWLRMSKTLSEDLSSVFSTHIGQLQESGRPGLPWLCTPVYIIKNKANFKPLTSTIANVYWAPAIAFPAGTGDTAVRGTQQWGGHSSQVPWSHESYFYLTLCAHFIWQGTEAELMLRSSNKKKKLNASLFILDVRITKASLVHTFTILYKDI